MRKSVAEIFLHAVAFTLVLLVVLVLMPLFLEHFGVMRWIIEESVGVNLLMAVVTVVVFVVYAIYDIASKREK